MLVALPPPSAVCDHQKLFTFISIPSVFLICYLTLYITIQVRAWGGYKLFPFCRVKSMETVFLPAKNLCLKKRKKKQLPSLILFSFFFFFPFFFRNEKKELKWFKITYWQVSHWFNWHKHKPLYFSKDFCICYQVILKQIRCRKKTCMLKKGFNS